MANTVRVLLGSNLIIMIYDEFFEVKLYHKGMKMKKNIAYIMDGSDIVKVYRGKYKDGDVTEPGLYNKDGEIIEFVPSEYEYDHYRISRIKELNIDKIFENITNHEEDFVQPEDIEAINNNTEIYIPTLKDDDDFLKYLVKKIIIEKKINLKNYKGRFSNNYALTNMKSGLNRSTKMTVTNFKMWCEILGIRWEMVVEDSGEDKLSPLKEPITITSEDF